MKFDLIRPCAHCPFRSDIKPFLRQDRAEEIAETLLNDGTFTCHKTVDYDDDDGGHTTADSQHCAGATIVLELIERPNQMMRIAERLGIYDRAKLKMDSPVYQDLDDWIYAQEGGA